MKYLLLTVLLALTSSLQAQYKGFEFNTSSKNDVIKKEGRPAESDQDNLYYKQNLGGEEAIVNYEFHDDFLLSVVIAFTETHTNTNIYINEFKAVDKILLDKYKTPKNSNSRQVLNKSFAEIGNMDDATLLTYGAIQFLSNWELTDMDITHFLVGDNFQFKHLIMYRSKRYDYIMNKKKASDF